MVVKRRGRATQWGMASIDAFIVVFMFAMGLLVIVGLQGGSEQRLSAASQRARAAMAASELIAEIQTVPASSRQALYASSLRGERYLRWRERLTQGAAGLAGAAQIDPVVEVIPSTATLDGASGTEIRIRIGWRGADLNVAQYVTSAHLSEWVS